MIVLHAGINEDQLFLWGETEDIPEAKKAPDKGPKFGTNAPLPYAMDLGPKPLLDIIRTLPGNFKPNRKFLRQLLAWLPTQGHKPVPSPLLGNFPNSRRKFQIAPWRVTVYELENRRDGGLAVFLSPNTNSGSRFSNRR